MGIICALLNIYLLAVLGVIILSWFPLRPGGFPHRIFGYLRAVVDPVLSPLRRVLPRLGSLDFSPVILILGIGIIARLVGCTGVI
jgi:YggT family protein